MHLLILDFMARRWWVFLCIFAFAVLGASLGALFVFTPFVMGVMITDQQGWLRVANGLPLSRRAQATALWSVGVLLPALIATLGLLIGALIFHLTSGPQLIPLLDAPTYTLVLDPKYFAPGFSLGVGASFGLGYAALCFLIFFVFPTRVQGKFGLACVALLTPLAPFGPMFIGFILPKNPGMMVTWHWVALASVPILALLSWLAAHCIFGGRVVGRQTAGQGTGPSPSLGRARGLTGLKLFLADSIFVALIALLSIIAISRIQILYESALRLSTILWPMMCIGVFWLTSFFSSLSYDLRILRSLPLSTSRLALLRMFNPITCGLCHALIFTALGRSEIDLITPTLWFFTLFISFSGACALVIACKGQFAEGTFASVAGYGYFLANVGSFDHAPPLLASLVLCVGAAALLLSFYLFKRGLRKSEPYQNQQGIKALETA
jgi:hypothetical protein